MDKITNKQKRVLECVIEFINKHNYAPSSREVAAILNYKSPATTHGHLVSLKNKGYIDWEEAKPRTLRVLKGA